MWDQLVKEHIAGQLDAAPKKKPRASNNVTLIELYTDHNSIVKQKRHANKETAISMRQGVQSLRNNYVA